MNPLPEKIYVAGHTGLVGSAVCRALSERGIEPITIRSRDMNLVNESDTLAFFRKHRPEAVIMCAGVVGGIKANNDHPVSFLGNNLRMVLNVAQAAQYTEVQKLLYLGSSCIYPRDRDRPLTPDDLMNGPLEPTNRAYAVAKIAGIELCRAYRQEAGLDAISAMPCNLYGPGDRYDPDLSHVIPALIRKLHEAKQQGRESVTLWGDGSPRREFLYSDDLAEALLLLLTDYSGKEIVNIGPGHDVTIKFLANTIRSIVGYEGEIQWNTDMPNGTPRKRMDNSVITDLGWTPATGLWNGLCNAYTDFLKNHADKV